MQTSNNFDSIAHLYDQTRVYPKYIHDHILELLELIGLLNPESSKILEFGIGTGRMAVPFLQKGYGYVGVDISDKMLDVLREKLNGLQVPNVELHLADASRLPVESHTMDMIWGTKVLRHIPTWKDVVLEARRALRPGGIFVHGEEYWVQPSSTHLVRGRWQEFVGNMKEEVNLPPGTTDDDEIKAAIEEFGGQAHIVTLASWQVEETFASKIRHFESRGGSSTFGVSDESLARSIQQLKEWAQQEFGDLEKPHPGVRGYRIVVGRF